jgi:hypothetical protein
MTRRALHRRQVVVESRGLMQVLVLSLALPLPLVLSLVRSVALVVLTLVQPVLLTLRLLLSPLLPHPTVPPHPLVSATIVMMHHPAPTPVCVHLVMTALHRSVLGPLRWSLLLTRAARRTPPRRSRVIVVALRLLTAA